MANTKPKSTKTTKSVGSSSKSAVKKKSLLSRINFRSKKVQLLVLVASFALIGGSFMAYKSFASNTVVGGMSICQSGNCDIVVEKSKNNASIPRLGGYGQRGKAVNAVGDSRLLAPGQYNVCAIVKTAGGAVNFSLQNGTTVLASQSVLIAGTGTSYINKCTTTPLTLTSSARVVGGVEYATTAPGQRTANVIFVSTITINKVVAPMLIPPAPKPAK